MASKVTKWAMDWITGIMTCNIEAIGKTSTYDIKVIWPQWESLTEIQKHTIYTGIKPKLEDSTAEGKDMKQTPAERYAKISNMWQRLTVDEIWTKKGEGRDSIQKRMEGIKIISMTQAKFAIEVLKIKVGADTKVVSDEEFAKLQEEADEE